MGLFFITYASCSEKVFTFVTLDYPPFISEKLIKENKSWVLDVVKAALEPQGYKIQVVIKPWARALHEAKNGDHDGLYAAGWTKERLSFFEYSVPIGQITKGFFKRKDREDVTFTGELSSLKNYKIAVGRGFITTVEFDNASYLNKLVLQNSKQGLKMLYKNRVDLVVASKEVDDYRFQELIIQFPNIKKEIIFIKQSLSIQILYMAISKRAKNYQIKLRDLNIGLQKIMLDGTYIKILRKHGVM